MPFYQDKSGAIHFLSDSDIDNGGEKYLPSNCTKITDAQAAAIQNPQPTSSQLAEKARLQRDNFLVATQWLVQRHRDQIEIGAATTLSADQFKELQTYRQALRDVPAQNGFPASITWPAVPACAQEVE
ncbi:phage tail assembly chaperone [Chromobacterium haemolyticum]|uniref:Phage tail assembly chaperone-like domain-containing protein n=1 Tax=Chromobacterium haemolyticum TaxID=394935 RepID=A0A1W0D5R5_9NEIS|nr:phage tail assembly chaperone [Chromobacterium haemolyticum]OQS42349.1 hypothetical protein B0T45_06055 [Chromobacterium haemolyticum]